MSLTQADHISWIPEGTFRQCLYKSKTPTLLLDHDAIVHWKNDAATALLHAKFNFSIQENCFFLQDPSADSLLKRQFRDILRIDPQTNSLQSITINFAQREFTFEIIPAISPNGFIQPATPLALVMIHTSRLNINVAETLQQIHGLTKTEARLAVIMADGISIEDAAHQKHVSPHTIRTQLKSIFSKTGVTKQSALTALVWRARFDRF